MIRRLFIAAFWLAATFAFVMAILPHPPEVPGDPSDKVQHILAFATLTLLGCAAYPSAPAILLGGLAVFGGLIELVQAIPALHRSSDVKDWIADVAAVLITLGITLLLRRAGLRLPGEAHTFPAGGRG